MNENKLTPEEMFREEEQKVDSLSPDPDPETVKMLEELESEKADPDKLLLDVMENVRDAIVLTIAETEEWGASTAQMLEVDEKVNDLAHTAMMIYSCMKLETSHSEARSLLDKLRLMREVEQRNDERIKEWSEKQ